MQYTEEYVVTLTTPAGEPIAETYDDQAEAQEVYNAAARMLTRGAKVTFERRSVVQLGMTVRAK